MAIFNIRDISVRAVVTISKNGKHLRLQTLDVLNIGKIDVQFKGNNFGPLNWIISQVLKVLAKLIIKLFRSKIQSALIDATNSFLKDIPEEIVLMIGNALIN